MLLRKGQNYNCNRATAKVICSLDTTNPIFRAGVSVLPSK